MTRVNDTKMLRRVLVATATIAVIGLSGCATPAVDSAGVVTSEQIKASAEEYSKQGHAWLASVLEDGVVDANDYESAFARLVDCMADRGYSTTDQMVNPIDGITYLYRIEPGGVASEVFEADDTECSNPDFDTVEGIYVNVSEQEMDESLRVATLECMTADGYEVDNDARDIRDFVGDPAKDDGAQRQAAMDCVGQEARRLFPEIPYIAVSY